MREMTQNYPNNKMNAIEIESNADRYVISIDKHSIDKSVLFEILERLQVEKLAQKINFSDDIIALGEEINHSWWQQNKYRFIRE